MKFFEHGGVIQTALRKSGRIIACRHVFAAIGFPSAQQTRKSAWCSHVQHCVTLHHDLLHQRNDPRIAPALGIELRNAKCTIDESNSDDEWKTVVGGFARNRTRAA